MHYNKTRLQYSMQSGYYILQHHIIYINMQQYILLVLQHKRMCS